MNVFDRLAIGCANWGPTPYGHKGVQCPREEQEKIIGYAMSCGIHTLDTAVAYNVDLSWVPTCFEIVMKVRDGDDVEVAGRAAVIMSHNSEAVEWARREYRHDLDQRWGQSLYDPGEPIASTAQVVQLPYSAFDRRWEEGLGTLHNLHLEIHVRSIFVQGKVFTSDELVFVRFRQYAAKLNLPVGTLCILFCLLNPNVDKVIIGVDSEQQLRENLRFFHRLDGFGVDDPNIIDPRRWERK
jgi:aryl-alcohol dehydrogenase-like predicted oxidoreductase